MLQSYAVDGLPLRVRIVRDFLDNTFLRRWIGKRGPLQWPPYSSDLTPCDFWLWGMVKESLQHESSEYQCTQGKTYECGNIYSQ